MQTLVGISIISCFVIFVNYIVTFKPPVTQINTPSNNKSVHIKKPINTFVSSGYKHNYSSYTSKAVNRLLYRIQTTPKAVKTVVSACLHYEAPVDVCLTLWWLESGMGLGGDKGGAGGSLALNSIEKLTNPANSKRWKRFKVNKHDLLAIAQHCGFNPHTVQGSWTGALGPFQFQPSTWIKVAIDANGDNKACPLNLTDSAYGAAKFIKLLRQSTNSWNKAVRSYSGGSSAYMHRSKLVRWHFCQIIKKFLATNLTCSMTP